MSRGPFRSVPAPASFVAFRADEAGEPAPKADKVALAYADPLDVLAVLALAKADAMAARNFAWWDRLELADKAVRELAAVAQAFQDDKRHTEFSHDYQKDVNRCPRCQARARATLALAPFSGGR